MGNIDYVKDGKIHVDIPSNQVMVVSKAEAESTLADYPPGTIAFTAGYVDIWQKAADATWKDFE